ncbi:hypothetical protein BHE74_00022314 [Ensete ventricosum]|nr:hypothetical protein GW17_00031116 [Ensete ventricosum]RWW70037.1 hypothetical protein BHE74_00022314 [Ensete ventricosum]
MVCIRYCWLNWKCYQSYFSVPSLSGDDSYKYNVVPPLPARLNLTPPPTLCPQQPVSASENYRFSPSGSPEIGRHKIK